MFPDSIIAQSKMERNSPRLILASQSPRRAELLAQSGYEFSVHEPHSETEQQAEKNFPPEELVVSLAYCKAQNVVAQIKQDKESGQSTFGASPVRQIVLGADTVAVCQHEVLGKPVDRDDAFRMLKLMSGNLHHVLTGVCLWDLLTDHHLEKLSVTTLRMDFLDDHRLDQFLQTEDWRGKAGGFGYQDGLDWLHIVEGLESNVVGLPVENLGGWISELLCTGD
jgi:septum formation protein